jgi:hypothetical protein
VDGAKVHRQPRLKQQGIRCRLISKRSREGMDLSELLQQLGQGGVTAQAPDGFDVEGNFDQLAGLLPKEALAGGLAEAFRSDQTPPFASMLGGLFGNSGGSQQASVLNTLLSIAGPMILQQMMGGGGGRQQAAASGGGLGDILGAVMGGGQQSSGGGGGLGDILGAVLGGGQQRSSGGGLGDILGAVMGGGGGAGAAGGGALAGILGQMMQSGEVRQLTAEEAAQVSPEEVQALAEHAAQNDPSIMDRLSEIYAEHPTLIKTLGSGALMLALSKIAQSQRQ